MNLIKKIFSGAFFIIICVYIFEFFNYFAKYICVHSESFIMPFTNYSAITPINSFHEMFFHSDHCWYIFSFVFTFIEKNIPQFLKMHPQEAIIYSAKFILFPIFLILLYTFTNSMFKYQKHTSLFFKGLGMGLSCFMVFCALASIYFLWIFHSNCWFLAYMFLPIFGIALYNIAEYYYVTGEKIPKKTLIGIVCLILCIAVSHEYFKFMLAIMIPLIYFLNYVVFKTKIPIKTFLLHFGLYCSIIFVCLLNNITSTYRYWLLPHLYNDFNTYQEYVIKFFKGYKLYVIEENIIYYAFIALLIIIVLSFVKEKEKKQRLLIFTLSTLISMFIFFIMIIVGAEHYDNYTDFVLPQHSGLRILLKFTLITVIFSYFGYLIQYLGTSIFKKIISFTFFSILCIYLFGNKYDYLDFYFKYQIEVKKNCYIVEKLFILNNKINNDNIFYIFNTNIIDSDGCLYMMHNHKSNFTYEKMKVKKVCTKDDEIFVCGNKMIEKTFEVTGYKFTEEELKELDFESLYKLNESN